MSKDGDGQYTTVGEAVKNAHSGSQIYIRPGVYNEKIVVDKSIELVGDGAIGEITMKGDDSQSIFVSNAKVKIRGLHLIGGVLVTKGNLEISDCNVSSSWEAIKLNDGAIANVQHTNLHNASVGISLSGASNVVITNCDIFSCSQQGVAVQPDGGHALVQKCHVHDNGREGVWVDKHGQATINGCDIVSSRDRPCVGVREGDLTIRSCSIHNSQFQGVGVEHSHLMMDHSEVFDNGWEGVAVSQASVATISASKIRSNHFSGVRIATSTVAIEDCDIVGNVESGVDVRLGRLNIGHSRVNNNGSQGVSVLERTEAAVTDSEIRSNGKGPYWVDPTGRLTAPGYKK